MNTPHLIPGEFFILKSYVSFIFCPELGRVPQYYIVTARHRSRAEKSQTYDQSDYVTVYTKVERKRALQIIENFDLKRVVHDNDVTCWDNAMHSFQDKYKGNILVLD